MRKRHRSMTDTDSTTTQSADADWAPDKVPFDEVFSRYEQMRQQCPVSHTNDRGGYWNVLRYKDIKSVIKDPYTFESGVPFVGSALKERFIPLTLNPPEHQMYRRILNPLMSRQRFEQMAPAVQALVTEILAPLLAAGGGDFASDVAYPLPARVLLKFLGLEDSTWGSLKAMSKERLEGRADPRRAQEAAAAFRAVVSDVVADRQGSPRDPETDFFSAILEESVDGQPMSTEDAVTIGYQLMAAGHDTTTSALTSAVYLLSTHPDVQQRLRADRNLIDSAVEEMLRFEPPLHRVARTSTKSTCLGGEEIPEGELVAINWAAANRDPEVFTAPNELDPARTPNRHLTFGQGVHMCLGAPLARLELSTVINTILDHTGWIELDGPYKRAAVGISGFDSLPIRFASRA